MCLYFYFLKLRIQLKEKLKITIIYVCEEKKLYLKIFKTTMLYMLKYGKDIKNAYHKLLEKLNIMSISIFCDMYLCHFNNIFLQIENSFFMYFFTL